MSESPNNEGQIENVDPKVELEKKLEAAREGYGSGKLHLKRIRRGEYETYDGEFKIQRNYESKETTNAPGVTWWLWDKDGNEVGDPTHDRLKDVKISIWAVRIEQLEEELEKLSDQK